MKNNSLQTWQLVLNWITRVLFFSSLSALLPTLPLYLKDIGGNKAQIGIVMSSFALGVLIFRPVVGKQVDTLGRKMVLMFGALVFIISPIFYVYIKSVPTLIPVRVFHGLGLAAFGTASITLITDLAPLKKRGEIISYTGIANTIAFAGGPVLGSYIQERWGHVTLFLFTAILAFACFSVSLLLHETKPEHKFRNQISYAEAIKQRRILVAFSIILLTALTHGGVMFYLPIFLKERLEINVGLFFAIYGLAALIVRFFAGKLSDRWGRGPVLVMAMFCLITGVLILSQIMVTWHMIISAILYGMGFGSYQPTLSALVADNTTEETRGKIFSFYYGGFDLGISLAGFILGWIAEHLGIQTMLMISSGIAFTALLIFITQLEPTISDSLRSAFSLHKKSPPFVIYDEFMEVSPKSAEEYYKHTRRKK